MRSNAAFTDCDTKACYDQIVAILTSLAEYKAGLPAEACILLLKALKQMQYTILTAYRPSKITNQHKLDNLLHGIGQGPTDAPAGCNFLSDICTKYYNKVAHRLSFEDPTQQLRITEKAKQFVDNKNWHALAESSMPQLKS
eukprot:11391302-Ditylum_brightwellii.AAC.1